MRAARYLAIPPWTLEERDDSRYWTEVALAAEQAEAKAKQAAVKRQNRR